MKTVKNLEAMSGPELVAQYNLLTGKSIKKFSTKADGIKAVTKALAALPDPVVEEKPKKAAKKKAVKADKEVVVSRTDLAVELLRKGAYTINELMEEFNTTYKNITGTLFYIRKLGKGLRADEKLRSIRVGMKTTYTLCPEADDVLA